MAVLDSTIVNVALPKIMASFGVGLDKIEWVLTAYMLALALMLPVSAWLADNLGYKRMYFIGLLSFTTGSLMCGFSHNENLLIFSRVIQGLGAGMIQPLGMAIVVREFPPQQRGLAVGFWTIAAAASISFGPLLGGFLVDNFNWQLIFDINIPVGILGMLATIVIQREMKVKRVGKFDVVGLVSVALFLPVILFALTEGNAQTNSGGWHAPYILFSLAISAIALTVFITNELVIENPLIDLRLLGNFNFGMSNLIMFLFGVGMFGSTFLLPLYLQNSLGYTALQSGSVFLPVGIIQGLIAPIAGIAVGKMNPKIPIGFGILMLAISFYLNSQLSSLSEHTFIMIPLYLRGLGMGIIFTSILSVSLIDIPREKMAQASGITNVIRQLGGSFGVALLSTLLTVRYNYHSQIYNTSIDSHSQVYTEQVADMSKQMVHESGVSYTTAAMASKAMVSSYIAKESYVSAIDDDFLLATIITIIGGIPVFFLRTKKKSQS
jgi:DHA2 family multidrug resistance protein